ncbi:hypothetical protein SEA_MARGARET_69 [Gordonia phage Margaret]|nr:hypothetical protein SEA_MARGARET_69 [Gordonia phage Margaret]
MDQSSARAHEGHWEGSGLRKNKVEDLERELIGYMPQSFVLMYYDLVEKGHAQYTSPLGHPGEGGQQTGKRYVTHDGGLRDEEALSVKRKIDRTLRQLVRDIDAGNRSGRPKCARCAKFMDQGWTFCAWCGAGVREEVHTAPEINANDVQKEVERRQRQEAVRRPGLR